MAEIEFAGLPFWQGTRTLQAPPKILPFGLERDPRGFWCQNGGDARRQDISNIYATDDYAFITPPPGASEWANDLADMKTSGLLACCPSLDGMDVLEIGAGSLFIAQALKSRFNIRNYVAIDPTITESLPGVDVVRDYFPNKLIEGQEFDLIIAFSCLEHVVDPVLFLSECAGYLRPEGAGIFLEFPDVSKALQTGDVGIFVHEHLSYFDEAGFSNAVSASGLHIRSLQSTKGSFLSLCGSGRKPAPLKPIINDFATSFREGLQHLVTTVRHDVAKMQVAFHGANSTLNNFLWLAGLSNEPRLSIFDNDSSKWGRYLPTCPTPIRSPAEDDYVNADIIYIAANQFFDEIQHSLRRQGIPAERVRPLLPPATGKNIPGWTAEISRSSAP